MVELAAIGWFLLGQAKDLGTLLLGGVLTGVAGNAAYEAAGRPRVDEALRKYKFDGNKLPINCDLENASRQSLQEALQFAHIATLRAAGGKPTAWEMIQHHWAEKSFPEGGLMRLRETQQTRWLDTFARKAKHRVEELHETIHFDPADIPDLLEGEETGLEEFVHGTVAQWVENVVDEGQKPPQFDEGLLNGWAVEGRQDGHSCVTFYLAYCLSFREKMDDETTFRKFVAPAVGRIEQKIDLLIQDPASLKQLHQSALKGFDGHLEAIQRGIQQLLAGQKKTNKELKDIKKQGAATHQLIEEHLQPAPHKPAIPEPVGDFVGREDDLRQLLEQVDTQGVLIAGVAGQGGIGKTQLAYKAAQELKSRYPEGQIAIELFGTQLTRKTTEQAMEEVLRALLGPKAPLPEDAAQLGHRYQAELAPRRVLLLLDNAADSDQVKPLLPPSSCGVLVTSRQYFELPGLYPQRINDLTPDEAEELILEINPAWGELATELARECGYRVLAVRVAASAIKRRGIVTPQKYLEQFKENRLAKLDEVASALRTSYLLLDPPDQVFWRRLGIFQATFDPAAAAEVSFDGNPSEAPDPTEILSRLQDANFVDYDPDSDRLSLHDLARDFACQQLSDEESENAGFRHASHYLTVLAEADATYRQGGENVLKGLNLYDTEQGNIAAAHAWALQHQEHKEQAARMVAIFPDAGAYTLSLRLHARERIRWLEAAVTAARKIGDRQREGNALGNLGNAYSDMRDNKRAIKCHEQALVISKEIADRRAEGQDLGNLGNAYRVLGDNRRAIDYYKQVLVITRDIGDRQSEGNALGNLGNAYGDMGDNKRAIEYYKQRIEIACEIGDRLGEGNALFNWAYELKSLGQVSEAASMMQQAAEIFTAIDHPNAEEAHRLAAERAAEAGE